MGGKKGSGGRSLDFPRPDPALSFPRPVAAAIDLSETSPALSASPYLECGVKEERADGRMSLKAFAGWASTGCAKQTVRS